MNKKIWESLAASYEDRKKQQEFFRGLGRENLTIEEEPIPNKQYEYQDDMYSYLFGKRSGRTSGRTFGEYYRNAFRDTFAYSMKCGNPYCPICFPKSEFYNENTIQGEVVEEWPEIEA